MTREPLHALDDERLGRAIAGLDLAWPRESEDLAARVEADLRTRTWRPNLSSRAKIVLVVAATVALLATAAVAAKLVIDLGAVTIEPIPSDRPLPTTSAIPDIGRAVSVEQAEAMTGTKALVPTALGDPDRVWVDTPQDEPEGASPTRIVMAWVARPGLPAIPGSRYGAVLIRWDAHVAAGVKLVGGSFRYVEVPGWPEAFWVRGPHELVLFDDEGPVRLLVRGHILLWGDETTTFRLETRLSEDAAIEVAASTP